MATPHSIPANSCALLKFKGFVQKGCISNFGRLSFFAGKMSFLHTLYLENEALIDRKNYGTILFKSKQVSLPKISSTLQKMKIGQNSIYALFAQSPSIDQFRYIKIQSQTKTSERGSGE